MASVIQKRTLDSLGPRSQVQQAPQPRRDPIPLAVKFFVLGFVADDVRVRGHPHRVSSAKQVEDFGREGLLARFGRFPHAS
jgi:hypothetical protein